MKSDKSVLVIDTPESCEKCILYNATYYPDKNKKENICYKRCPLKPIPKMAEVSNDAYVSDYLDFDLGWNACLKAITGEKE